MSATVTQEFIDHVPYAEDEELPALLIHQSFIVRAEAVCEVALRKLTQPEFVCLLEKLVEDKTIYVGITTIGDFASAALILLGKPEKAQKNEEVNRLVKSELRIFRGYREVQPVKHPPELIEIVSEIKKSLKRYTIDQSDDSLEKLLELRDQMEELTKRQRND